LPSKQVSSHTAGIRYDAYPALSKHTGYESAKEGRTFASAEVRT
jgi:hypothetical protein